jgi:hypothetical protein
MTAAVRRLEASNEMVHDDRAGGIGGGMNTARHDAIIASAKALASVAQLLLIAGWLAFIGGIVVCAVEFNLPSVSGGVAAAIIGLVSGTAFRAASALCLMIAGIGMAVRDLATREADK